MANIYGFDYSMLFDVTSCDKIRDTLEGDRFREPGEERVAVMLLHRFYEASLCE
jgi:hypothetical protein